MENCRGEMTAGENTLAEIKIQRSILQGDALSTLSCVIDMMPLNHIHQEMHGRLQTQ